VPVSYTHTLIHSYPHTRIHSYCLALFLLLRSLALNRGNVGGVPGALLLEDVATRELDDGEDTSEWPPFRCSSLDMCC
jgi:hypothetical protein